MIYVRFRIRDHNGIDCTLRHDKVFELKNRVSNSDRKSIAFEELIARKTASLETLGFIPYKQR